ncbi:uncharacterized protein LOC134817545 [Bolinopsis microptera]|uniref:uncharacterized protein LOC134817545 n=1 Tax=Bolinopsis microptera TaxID=2820187 RepID=UPI0030791E07
MFMRSTVKRYFSRKKNRKCSSESQTDAEESLENSHLAEAIPTNTKYSSIENEEETFNEESVEDAINQSGIGFGTLIFVLSPCLFILFEGAEDVIQSYMSDLVTCHWELSLDKLLFIEIGTVIGMLAGSLVCSPLSDKYGRRNVIMVMVSGLLIFGNLTAFAVGFTSYLTFQIMVGFFVGGGIAPVIALLVEVVPSRWRVAVLALRSAGRASGIVYAVAAFWLLNESLGWRSIILAINIINIPALVFVCLSDESSQYRIAVDDEKRAKKSLARLQSLNVNKAFFYCCLESNVKEVDAEENKSEIWRASGESLNESEGRRVTFSPSTTKHSTDDKPEDCAISDLASSDLETEQEDAEYNTGHSAVSGSQISAPEKDDESHCQAGCTDLQLPIKGMILMAAYGFIVQAIYYGYTFYNKNGIKDRYCADWTTIEPPVSMNVALLDDCAVVNTHQLFEQSMTSIIGPVGAILTAISAVSIGRKKTGYIIALLLVTFNFFFYNCPNSIDSGIFNLIVSLVSILKCGADLLPLVVASEYFSTSNRGMGLSACVTGSKLGATLSILVCHYGHDGAPYWIAGYLHLLSVLMIVVVFVTRETKRV